jgi:hypothetical protein
LAGTYKLRCTDWQDFDSWQRVLIAIMPAHASVHFLDSSMAKKPVEATVAIRLSLLQSTLAQQAAAELDAGFSDSPPSTRPHQPSDGQPDVQPASAAATQGYGEPAVEPAGHSEGHPWHAAAPSGPGALPPDWEMQQQQWEQQQPPLQQPPQQQPPPQQQQQQLLPDWKEAVSASTGETYYWNTVTGESSYDRPGVASGEVAATEQQQQQQQQPPPQQQQQQQPPPLQQQQQQQLPPDWQEAVSASTGETYYWNTVTGESSYDRPGVAAGEVAHREQQQQHHQQGPLQHAQPPQRQQQQKQKQPQSEQE